MNIVHYSDNGRKGFSGDNFICGHIKNTPDLPGVPRMLKTYG
ncbi:hypothetical protein BSBH6_03361 [Bacillus subtilis]|nr:hypothetical protein BSBH6_03361 [Bacillus subtilis]RPK22556.1 hypothetical protein BH5_03367 [Bacillus subtilis]